MPKINVQLAEPTIEPKEKQTYKITKAEEITTQKEEYKAIRVSLKQKDEETEYATMLWISDTIPSNSKLGCFIDAFNSFYKDNEKGYDTDNWLNHEVRFISWVRKDRQIEVIS